MGGPTPEQIEKAAEAIWNLAAFPHPWTTWQERIEVEKTHRMDKSWQGPVARCRAHARAALATLTPAIPGEGETNA